jgi:glycosyltransferase involved in cell wall biosynthesis
MILLSICFVCYSNCKKGNVFSSMKILMHDNALNERGTTAAVESYAEILLGLGWSVDIAFKEENSNNVPEVIDRIGKKFQLIPYSDFKEIRQAQSKYDVAYFIKSGENDGIKFDTTPSLIHAVFQSYDPHGASYVYNSQWLAKKMQSRRFLPSNLYKGYLGKWNGCLDALDFNFLPHVCNVKNVVPNRNSLSGIEDDSFVVLRYGGWDSFDNTWVQDELLHFVEQFKNTVVLMVNTKPFCSHKRILFLRRFTHPLERDNLLAACDVFIHARNQGESFGLSIVEAMQANKQVLSWSGGKDQNHIELLRSSGALFANKSELRSKLECMYSGVKLVDTKLLSSRSQQFRPEMIAPKFESLLLEVLR